MFGRKVDIFTLFTFGLFLFVSACGGGGGDSGGTSATANTPEAASYNVRASTLNEETERVWSYLERYQWYINNGYNLSLPDHPLIAELVDKSLNGALNREDDYPGLLAVMSIIYDDNDYVAALNALDEGLAQIAQCRPVFLEYKSVWASQGWDFKTFDSYTIRVTLYGTAGSYNPANGTIIVRARTDGTFSKNPASTVIHESVEIAIYEEVAVKFGLTHWVKERIVGRFCFDNFGYTMQAAADKSIDPYLDHPDSWQRLPYYVGQYLLEQTRLIQS
jgi:hypothetical protein